MSTSPFRPLTFGEILDGAFTLYRRHFLVLFITALLPYVPVGVLSGWFAGAAPTNPAEASAGYFGLMLLLLAVSFLGFALMWVALTREAAQAYTGGEVSLGDGFRQGARSFLYTLVAGGVAMMIIWVFAFVLFFGIGIVVAVLTPVLADATAVIVAFSVVVVLIALAAMVAIFGLFFAVVPAIVIERRGPFEAIGRSLSLAWGALPRVVGVTVVSSLILILPLGGLLFFLGMTQGFAKLMGGAGAMSPGAIAVQQLASTVVYALVLPFFATSFVLLYFDRRARTEAHDLEGLVANLGSPAPAPPPAFGGA